MLRRSSKGETMYLVGDLGALNSLRRLGEEDKGEGENHQQGDDESLNAGHDCCCSMGVRSTRRDRGGEERDQGQVARRRTGVRRRQVQGLPALGTSVATATFDI
jgi:hypothetical protein